jgi:hypothetical protein
MPSPALMPRSSATSDAIRSGIRPDPAHHLFGKETLRMEPQAITKSKARNWSLLLLLIPFIGTLYVPFYNSTSSVFGIPFFFAYLIVWVPISAIITGVVYAITK